VEKKSNRKLWIMFLALIGAALLGSVWAWAAKGACGTCDGARDLLSHHPLAPLGATLYGAVLGAAVFFGPNRFSFVAVSLAAAFHLVLLVLLVHRGLLCPPCIVTGTAAIAAMIVSFVIDPANLGRTSLTLPLGAVACHAILFASGAVAVGPRSGGQLAANIPEPREERAPLPHGTASVLIYTRPGCRYCDELERDVLPAIVAEFGDALEVERTPAPEGLPSPTIIVRGAVRTVFPGLPPSSDLAGAIARAIGGKRDVAPLLPEPR
jgi:hypothetical protein